MSAILKITQIGLSVLVIFYISFLWAHEDKHEKKVVKTHWAAPLEEGNQLNPVKDTIESVQRGQNLYIANCAACHGPDAEGDGPDAEFLDSRPSNLRAMAGHHPDGDMAWKIRTGKDDMTPWKDVITEKQTWDLVNFIQNLKKMN